MTVWTNKSNYPLETTTTPPAGGTGSAAWGGITGTLSDQTDLQTALNGKQAAGSYEPANSNIQTHIADTANPHGVTALQAGARDLSGWPSPTGVTLSFVDGTRTLSVTPTGATFYFHSNGVKYTKTGAQSVVIANTVGLHFVYFDTDGTLKESTTPWDITATTVPTAIVYWNGTSGAVGLELHQDDRDRHLHAELHHTVGTRFDSSYGNLLAGTFTNTTFSINTGRIWDEDIDIIISAQTSCRLWYRNGADYTFEAGVTVPAKVTAGALKYDNAGTLTSVSAAQYVANWVYATNDISYPIYIAVGQQQHTTLNAARSASELAFPTTLPTREWKLLYKIIFQNSGGTATYIESQDYRTSGSVAGGSITTLPASNVTFNGPIGALSSGTVQAALEELDTEKAPIAQTMYIGTTAHAINRASASEALTGITSIDGSAATLTTARNIGGRSFNGSADIIAPTCKTGITTRDVTTASGTVNVAHGLGRVPSVVRVKASLISSASVTQQCFGVYDGTNHSGMSIIYVEGTSTATTDQHFTSTSFELGFSAATVVNPYTGANRQTATITCDATNIIFTWVKTGTVAAATANILWEVM